MITGQPDKKIPFYAAHTYFDEMLKAGVRLYLYDAGFMHTKTVIIDDSIVSAGTTNMDVRSFKLNYEVNAVIYDAPTARDFSDAFTRDMEVSRELTTEAYQARGLPRRIRDAVARLVSPLL